MQIRALLLISIALCACASSPESKEGNSGTGGNTTAIVSNSGGTAPSTTSENAEGGTTATSVGGGTNASGGTPAATGGAATGGAATGGAATGVSTGGAISPGTGGATSTSGAASGGASPTTGGASGGTRPAVGGTSTAGNTATGGATVVTSAGGAVSGAIYVSPTGVDTNPGTFEAPYYTLAKAVARAAAGVTIYMRGGQYDYSSTITLAATGTQAAPIAVLAYQSEKPVLDFSTQPYASNNRGLLLTGNYWQIKGLEIAHAGDNGLKIEGSHNRIELCVFHHNGDAGVQLGFGHETVNPNGELCAYNEIINCDSYMNFDFDNRGSDADGFACKMHNGKGNAFRGCRSWHNSDDGWDLYETDWPVEITNCWTWHNGDQADFDAIYLAKMGTKMSSYSGNGNGFKLGGNGTGGSSVGTHVVTNCVSFNNNYRSKKGFDQNSHKGGVLVRNCTAWGNGYNFMFEEDANSGSSNEFDNNVSFASGTTLAFEFSSGAILRNNSWQLAVTPNAADFIDTTEGLAGAPREADGSLPNNGFARLATGSDLVDRGLDIGLPFKGAAPDLGAYEQ